MRLPEGKMLFACGLLYACSALCAEPGTDWKLVYDGSLTNGKVFAAWIPLLGDWIETPDGVTKLERDADGLLMLRAPAVREAVRVEYEARSAGPVGDLSLFLGMDPADFSGAAFLGFGSAENTMSILRQPGVPAVTNRAVLAGTGAWHRIEVVRAGGRLSMAVDGVEALAAEETPSGFPGPHIGLYCWQAGTFRNVRVWQRDDAMLRGRLNVIARQRKEASAAVDRLREERLAVQRRMTGKTEPLRRSSDRMTDWPAYRCDASRAGCTDAALPEALGLHWVWKSRQAPQPAWPGRDTRMSFDRVFHPVIAGGILFFGSSADGAVRALDTQTGVERWSFFTGGPVRFAPAVWRDRLFVASDDGFLYCLATAGGKMLWKLRGGPGDGMVLGNGRMISRWPVRGGPVVVGETVYFAAGIWPSEGIFVYAVSAASGEVLWRNDSSGNLMMEQPHPENRARSGISAQGYLAADDRRLFVPTGRGVPAVFDRATGNLLYFHLAVDRKNGGAEVLVGDGWFVNNGSILLSQDGQRLPSVGQPISSLSLPCAGGLADWNGGIVRRFRWALAERAGLNGVVSPIEVLETTDSIPCTYGGAALIMVGTYAVSAGWSTKGAVGVSALDLTAHKEVWSEAVEGVPFGLAAAGERLYASTDRGYLYCFGPPRKADSVVIEAPRVEAPYGENRAYAAAAQEILRETGVSAGYCVDLACGEGALAYELARRSDLHICAVEQDAGKAALARERLDRAGLYGTRVVVHVADPAACPYPAAFANLVVSGRAVEAGAAAVPEAEMRRLQRPYGGAACIGQPGRMSKNIRGKVAGAGEWTHQYADAAGTFCSADALVRAPLRMFWFADFGIAMPDRHGRGPAPLYKDGVLVIAGVHGLSAVDAYNGRRMWEFPLPDFLKAYDQGHLLGTAGTGGNMCLGDDSVFIRHGGRVFRLDLASGKKAAEYPLPGQEPGVWGFIAWDNGTLYGSRADTGHVVRCLHGLADMRQLLTQSSAVFALDGRTGDLKWVHQAGHSIRHNAIAVGGGKVYLIDRPLDRRDRPDFGSKPQAMQAPAVSESTLIGLDDRPLDSQDSPDLGSKPQAMQAPAVSESALVCLDAATGAMRWKNTEDIYGTMLALSVEHDVLVMGYQLSQRAYQLPSETGDRLAGFRASDGARLWDAAGRYAARPIINGRRIYAQPFALDLLTGQKDKEFSLQHRQGGGCGPTAGSRNLLLYRSGTLGYCELPGGTNTLNYGGIRPGCWVNTIVGGGLVLMPDATDQCKCSYLMKASICLQPGSD